MCKKLMMFLRSSWIYKNINFENIQPMEIYMYVYVLSDFCIYLKDPMMTFARKLSVIAIKN